MGVSHLTMWRILREEQMRFNTIIATLIIAIPVGVALEVVLKLVIKKIHDKWIDTDLFDGLNKEI